MASEKETFEALRYHITMGKYGEKQYRNAAGQPHREEGPAIIWADGGMEWWQNGQRHCIGGPAVELSDGHREWWQNDQRHRIDGPAIVCKSGHTEWWLNGTPYTKQDHHKQLRILKQTP